MITSEKFGSPKIVAVSAFLILVSIFPNAIDPINSIKFQFLVFLGTYCSISFLTFLRLKGVVLNKKYFFVTLISSGCWISILICSPGDLKQQFLGTFGRNNGFISQTFLIIVFIFVINLKQRKSIIELIQWFLYGSTLSAIYGLMQIFGFDPVNWSGDGKQIVGFVGNTNFLSSLMALGIIVLLVRSRNAFFNIRHNLFVILNICLHLLVLIKTQAIQGFAVLLSIPVVWILIRIFDIQRNLIKKIALTSFLSLIFSFTLIFMATNVFTNLIKLQTIEIRKNYWIAAIRMFKSHPFFGVGFDSYGDWYRSFRPEKLNTGLSVVSNSAHNFFLEILANLGLVGFSIYLVGFIFIVRSFGRILSNSGKINNEEYLVMCLFVGFTLQSLISPIQLGLLVWHFIFGASIVALSKLTDSQKNIQNKTIQRFPKNLNLFKFLISIIISLIVASPVFFYQLQVRNSLDSQNFIKIEKTVNRFPYDPTILYQVALIADYNKLGSKEIDLLISASRSNPRFYEVWERLYKSPNSNSKLKEEALKQIQELEPKWQIILSALN